MEPCPFSPLVELPHAAHGLQYVLLTRLDHR
jgi:hypothetical protein